VKAITAANAQAAYSTNRANAQAAHDAALLSAMKDWRESSSAANLKSLVSSSQAENDFKASVAGFWADWNTATEGNDRWAPTGFLGSVTDSVMGLMNPFDTDSIARSLTTETKADTTNGPQRPKPSDIHVVYSIYGIVSEHTPEEWEVIREYQTKGRTWEEWMMGGERKRMDAAGFKTSFRKLEEDVPPAKVLPTPSPPSPAPVTPVLSNPILTPLDANNELMVSRDDFDLDITDTILGIIGGTRGDYIDESFNFLYGVGDNMSLGLGWWLRSTFFHDQADYGGSSYYIGGWVGFAGDLLMGVGAFKALGKTFGREALESGLRNAPVRGATIASPMRGNPAAIFHGYADLSKRQQGLLSSLGEYGSQVTVGKRAVSMKDLAALTAHTGDEFLMLTRKGERLIMRGSQQGFHGVVDDVWAKQMASQGWKWSGHTHPVLQGMSDLGTLMSSGGDRAILQAFGQSRSLILNSKGRWSVFDGN
jgi:hypothetical protein